MSYELSGNHRKYVEEYLSPMLNGLLDTEIFDEEGRLKEVDDKKIVEYAFQNWNADYKPTLIQNNSELTEGTDYIVDYDNGTIQLTTAFTVGDIYRCSYRFGLFNLATLGNFYDRALSFFNGLHPKTQYTLDNMPDTWVDALTEAAYKYCLQSIMMTASSWRGELMFKNPPQVISVCQTILSDVAANLQSRAQNIKGRSLLIPRSTASGRRNSPQAVTDYNWQSFTAIRGT